MTHEVRYLPRPTLEKFIECYRGNPCLWKVGSKEYTNRKMKQQAYEELIDICKTVYENADKSFVVKKVNTIRTVYRKELRRVNNSLRQSASGEDCSVYEPTLWYYHLMHFLKEQDVMMEPEVSFTIENNSYTDSIEIKTEPRDFEILDYCTAFTASSEGDLSTPSTIALPSTSVNTLPQISPQNPISPTPSTFQERSNKRKKIDDSEKSLPTVIHSKDGDEYDIVGRNIANKLRQMEGEQRIIAEFNIHKILYKGLRNMLTDDFD